MKNLDLIVFGQFEPAKPPNLGFPIKYMGHLNDQISLCLLYNAADVLAIPSRVDNLPNIGVESMACGTPVISFDTCGLPDIIVHKKNGFLAEPFEPESLANGIKWVLDKINVEPNKRSFLSKNARKKAVEEYSYTAIAKQYHQFYMKTLNDS